jgi:hypothetical protein
MALKILIKKKKTTTIVISSTFNLLRIDFDVLLYFIYKIIIILCKGSGINHVILNIFLLFFSLLFLVSLFNFGYFIN